MRKTTTQVSTGSFSEKEGAQTAMDQRDSDEELSEVLDDLLRKTGTEAAELFLREPAGNHLWLAAHRGIATREFQQRTEFALGEGFPGLVAERGDPILTFDLAADQRYLRSRVKARGFRYYRCVPLVASDSVIGSLHIASRRAPKTVTDHEPALIDAASRLAGMVELAQLRAKELISNLPADPRLDPKGNLERKLRHALEVMIEFTGADGGMVLLRDEETGSLHPWCWQGDYASACTAVSRMDPQSCACSTINQRRCLVAPAGPSGKSRPCASAPSQLARIACLPLFIDDRLLGAVSLGYRDRQAFPGRLLGVLSAMVERMSLEVADAQASVVAEQRAIVARDLRLLAEVDEIVERNLRSAALWIERAGEHQGADAVKTLRSELRGAQTLLYESSRDIAKSLDAKAAQAGSKAGDEQPPQDVAPEPGSIPPLDLRCFGTLTVFRNGQRIAPQQFKRRRAESLLKILLTRYGKPVHREVLIDLLWPDGAPAAAAKQLKVIVHDLRHALQPVPDVGGAHDFILWSNEGYIFNVNSPHRLDSRDFVFLVQWGKRLEKLPDTESALTAFESAANLYTADFLEDERYSDWCAAEREFLRETFISLQRHIAALLVERGDSEGAISSYRRILRTDGALEEVHRDLMGLLWQHGRRNEALRQYRVCCDLLQKERSLAPEPDTVRLYQRIAASG